MTAVLVTLAQAKEHLKRNLAVEPGDDDIQLKLDQAEAIILRYLDTSADPAWVSPATVPGEVSAVILLQLTDLYRHRGDDRQTSAETWQSITNLLVQWHKAALA
jgi:hypothetical protein